MAGAAVAALALLAPGAAAQSIEQQVRNAPDGKVLLSFDSRPDVCGHRDGISISDNFHGSWSRDCEHGPVRVVLRKESGRVTRVDTYVAAEWRTSDLGRGSTELGHVDPQPAADYLLDLADTDGLAEADEAIMGAVLADDAVIWQGLLDLARDQGLRDNVRKDAIFWLGQQAADRAVAELGAIAEGDDESRSIREQAVFALSQNDNVETIPTLIRLAGTSRYPEVRRSAMFWLADSEDDRAVRFFEEVLTQ